MESNILYRLKSKNSEDIKVKDIGSIIDYIIRTVSEESMLSGFQHEISFEEIEDKFNITLNNISKYILLSLLYSREEVTDVCLTEDTFDVVLCTDYVQNYMSEDYGG